MKDSTWRWIIGGLTVLCFTFFTWYVQGNFSRLDHQNELRRVEIKDVTEKLNDKIIGKDRYAADMTEVKTGLSLLISMHLRSDAEAAKNWNKR